MAVPSNLSPSAIPDCRLHRRQDAHCCREPQRRTHRRRSDRHVRSPCRNVAPAISSPARRERRGILAAGVGEALDRRAGLHRVRAETRNTADERSAHLPLKLCGDYLAVLPEGACAQRPSFAFRFAACAS
jgi:hypothetical protein